MKFGLTISNSTAAAIAAQPSSGTKAAIHAGYSPKVAAEVASENLRNSKIVERISELRADLQAQSDIRNEEILGTLAFHLRGDMAGMRHLAADVFQMALLTGMRRGEILGLR